MPHLVAATEKSNGRHANDVLTAIHLDKSAFDLRDLWSDQSSQCDPPGVRDVERDD
jgi:hypothetical protein